MASSLSCLLNSIDGANEGSANCRLLAKNRMCTLLGNLNFKNQSNLKAAADNFGMCVFGSRKSVEEVRTKDGCLRLRSAGNDFAESEFGESSEEDALQETIEKSKKLLSMQKEILQKIAERKKLLHSIKDSIANPVDGGISSQDAPNSHSDNDLSSKSWDTFVESNNTSFRSISSASSAGSKGDLAFDEEYNTSGSSVTSGMDSSEVEDIPASSAEFARNYSYSGNEQPTSSSMEKSSLGFGSVTETEEMSSFPAFLLNKASGFQYHEMSEESPLKEVTNYMSEPTPLAGDNVMNILLVAAECAPWSKTGGLGDVVAALPKALARRGHRVMVVAPRYENYPEAQSTGVLKRYKVAGQDIEVSYFHAYIDGVDFVFIDCALFRGIEKNIYGGNRQDILRRMVLFCKAAIEVPWHVPCGGACYGDGNLVFIANDWHAALLPVYLKAYYHDNGLMSYARSVLVIHNIAHQGRGPLNEFSYVDLPEHYLDSFRLYDPVGGEHLNIFAAGLKAAHRIVTVSHGYACEIKTQEGSWGLHNIINENDWKLSGIVNGIDTKEWSPQSDVHLQSDGYINYSIETLHVGKAKCKEALQRELNLPVRKNVPLIGFIGRLDDQKGVDIIGECIPWLMEQDVQLVMLGTGRPDLEQMLREFESQHHDRVRGWVGFSVKTAHRITAGADILLMPSRFEPCGLNQLYAMKYGTVPVVHAVGGLKDTVVQFDPYNDSGYGWTIDRAEPDKLKEALWNCLVTFREYRQSWEAIQRRGMSQNLSWDHAAEMYEEVLVAAKYQW